ncbi:MAG: acyltransferase [Eubacterium sp.]|nr:acyltransferase [Eubacterium sp.]
MKNQALKNNLRKPRNTNLELFRIISMLFIIAHHYVVNSGMMNVMNQTPFAPNSLFFYFFGAWGKTGINCFVMITGYFMCKSHITFKKFLKLLPEYEFYKIVIYIILAFTGVEVFSLGRLFWAFVPVKTISDGFVPAFIVFYLFIPFLNVLINGISEKMHIRLLILCLFLYTFLSTMIDFDVTMNYVSWFIVIYFIASYVRLYPRKIYDNNIFWFITSVTCILFSTLSILGCLKFGVNPPYYFISDSNKLFAVVTSFCLFMFFNSLNIRYNRFVNLIASTTLGILCIHAHSDAMRKWLWVDVLHNVEVFNSSKCYIHFLISVVSVFLICTIIDLFRIFALEKPLFKVFDSFFPKINSKLIISEENVLNKFKIKS